MQKALQEGSRESWLLGVPAAAAGWPQAPSLLLLSGVSGPPQEEMHLARGHQQASSPGLPKILRRGAKEASMLLTGLLPLPSSLAPQGHWGIKGLTMASAFLPSLPLGLWVPGWVSATPSSGRPLEPPSNCPGRDDRGAGLAGGKEEGRIA